MMYACQKTEELGPESLSLDPSATSYEFPVEGGTYTVELTATVDWSIQGYDDDVKSWLSITPSEGKASASAQTVTIKAMENTGANRKADLVFYGNIMHKAELTITQLGPEGEYASISIAEFIEKADTENPYVITGVVGDIATNAKYWGFSLKDDSGTISCPFIGESADDFLALGIHTGDKVSIKGVYEYYESKSEHQLSDGEIMDHTPLALDDIRTVTVAEFLEAADPYTMYRLTGEVSGSVNAQYCSFDLKDETGTVVVWTVNNASEYASTLKSGDIVTLRGAYTWFENDSDASKSKPEVVDATIESVEAAPDAETGTPEGTGTAEDPYNVAGAYKFIDDNQYYGNNDNPNVSPEKVYVKGTITSIEEVSTQFGNATYVISDGEGLAGLEVYRGYYFNGDKFTSEDQIKVGDEVVVLGQLTRFFETYEFTTGSQIYSLNGQTSGGGEPEPDPDQQPDPVPGDWIYSNSFNKGMGDFTIENKVMNDPLTFVWNHDASYECMKASAYMNSTNYESESWLVSPVIDLSSESAAYISFEHATNFFSTSTLADDASVWAREEGGSWEKVDGVTYPASQGWTFVSAGDIDVSKYAGKRMQFAFVYKSSASKAGTWEVKNVVVKNEIEVPTPTPGGSVVLTFPDDNNANNHVGSYTDTWTAISGEYEFSIANFNNNNWSSWTYIRCGRKSDPSVASISNVTAMPEISAVELTVDKITATKVNSIVLSIYSDSAQSSLVADGIEPEGGLAAGTMTFSVPAEYQAAGQYYKVTFDCPVAGSNGVVQISKVTYVAVE